MSLVPLPRLDQGRGVAGRHDVRRVLLQDRALALGRVVGVEVGDGVEQPRADVVVQPLRRQAPRLGAETATDVADEGAGGPVGVQRDRDDRCGRHRAGPVGAAAAGATVGEAHARQRPACAVGEEVAVRPARVARGVSAQPPRSTIWFDMNLPLYSPIAPSAGVEPRVGVVRRRRPLPAVPVDLARPPVAGPAALGWYVAVSSGRLPRPGWRPARRRTACSHSASLGNRFPAQAA